MVVPNKSHVSWHCQLNISTNREEMINSDKMPMSEPREFPILGVSFEWKTHVEMNYGIPRKLRRKKASAFTTSSMKSHTCSLQV